MFDTLRRDLSEFLKSIEEFGLLNGIIIQAKGETLDIRGEMTKLLLFGKDAITIRNGTSDLSVYRQIFIEREYSPLDNLTSVDWIIDCGANVGFSALYFLNKFPKSKVICIEPDIENFRFLTKNLKNYRKRAFLLNGAVWSQDGKLSLSSVPYRDGLEWGRQVCIPDENTQATVPAFSVRTLLEKYQIKRISIMKIDIEGAEVPLLREGNLDWINSVDNLAIELHDDTVFGNATESFFEAFQDKPFTFEKNGELTIAKRKSKP